MKSFKYIIGAALVALCCSSCIKDLNTSPIDPSINTPDKALTTPENYFSLLTQCYTGFAVSGSYGPNGANNISGVDGGYSQYFRGRYHLNGLTTDETVCGWNDQTLRDLHGFAWVSNDVFVAAFYYRIGYQISACNEFIRQAKNAKINLPDKDLWIAEARALRAFCWYDAIDNYGGFPFADENSSVGAGKPEYISRTDLFNYIESECKELLEGDALPEMHTAEYGRVDKGMVTMLLAKLYLNAEVYTGTAKYAECLDLCKSLESAYSLHNNFEELFMADNNLCTDELIFTIEQDGINVQSYGATNYLIFSCTGGEMDTKYVGISSGWGGLRATPEFYNKFSATDARNLFWTDGQQLEIDDISDFTNGMAYVKFRNVNHDGSAAKFDGFVDVDFPVYRYADALLMRAECGVRLKGGSDADALAAFKKVRERAGLSTPSSLTLNDIIDERARELALEGWRRSDLIRFGMFTGDKYVWAWKGGVKEGKGVDSHFDLFPLPYNDIQANDNLKPHQNPGY